MKEYYLALPNCMNGEGRLNKTFMKSMFYSYRKNNATGVFLCGNTCGLEMDLYHKFSIIDYAFEICEDLEIIVNVSCGNLKDSMDLQNHVKGKKCKYMAVMWPKEIIDYSDLKNYLNSIEVDIPILLYYNDQINNLFLKSEEIVALLKSKLICGMKYTAKDVKMFKEVVTRVPEAKMYWGRDDMILEGIKAGATGGIGGFYNIVPSYFSKILANGNEEVMSEYQKRVNFLILYYRELFPTLPGNVFVMKILNEYKKNLSDDQFYFECMRKRYES